jgi:hypothetical protein
MQKQIDAYNVAFLKSIDAATAIGLEPTRIIAEIKSGTTPFDLTVRLMKESALTGKPQYGFKQLLAAGRVDLTIESLIISPAHMHLFAQTHELRQIQRLADLRIKTGGQF